MVLHIEFYSKKKVDPQAVLLCSFVLMVFLRVGEKLPLNFNFCNFR